MLFLGACLAPPNLPQIWDYCKGVSEAPSCTSQALILIGNTAATAHQPRGGQRSAGLSDHQQDSCELWKEALCFTAFSVCSYTHCLRLFVCVNHYSRCERQMWEQISCSPHTPNMQSQTLKLNGFYWLFDTDIVRKVHLLIQLKQLLMATTMLKQNGCHFVYVFSVCKCVSPVALVPPLRIVDLGDVETAVTRQECVWVSVCNSQWAWRHKMCKCLCFQCLFLPLCYWFNLVLVAGA